MAPIAAPRPFPTKRMPPTTPTVSSVSSATPVRPAHDSPRTRVRVHPERSAPDEVPNILRDGLIAHVAIADDDGPVVIPMTYFVAAERPYTIYIHGAHHSRLMAHVASGKPVCVTVTMVDGLVYSRTALYHSMNYRSAVCFGTTRVVVDPEEQLQVAEGLVTRYFPGRVVGVDCEAVPTQHVTATSWVAIEVTDASAKIRQGPPKGPRDHDPSAPGTAGVIPFTPPR